MLHVTYDASYINQYMRYNKHYVQLVTWCNYNTNCKYRFCILYSFILFCFMSITYDTSDIFLWVTLGVLRAIFENVKAID